MAAQPRPNLCSDLKEIVRFLSSNKLPFYLVNSCLSSLRPYRGKTRLSGVKRIFFPDMANL
jgi:hypothetical protein